MGGVGSGRDSYSGRSTTEDYLSIDVRRWCREGMLKPGQVNRWQWSRNGKSVAEFNVQACKEYLLINGHHRIRLDWTDCYLGGKRPWFLCGCGKRVAILYCASQFSCRHCLGLVYRCQMEPKRDQAARRANRIRRKLGWPLGIFNPPGSKPKGMHFHTYYRLVNEYAGHLEAATMGISKVVKAWRRKLTH